MECACCNNETIRSWKALERKYDLKRDYIVIDHDINFSSTRMKKMRLPKTTIVNGNFRTSEHLIDDQFPENFTVNGRLYILSKNITKLPEEINATDIYINTGCCNLPKIVHKGNGYLWINLSNNHKTKLGEIYSNGTVRIDRVVGWDNNVDINSIESKTLILEGADHLNFDIKTNHLILGNYQEKNGTNFIVPKTTIQYLTLRRCIIEQWNQTTFNELEIEDCVIKNFPNKLCVNKLIFGENCSMGRIPNWYNINNIVFEQKYEPHIYPSVQYSDWPTDFVWADYSGKQYCTHFHEDIFKFKTLEELKDSIISWSATPLEEWQMADVDRKIDLVDKALQQINPMMDEYFNETLTKKLFNLAHKVLYKIEKRLE